MGGNSSAAKRYLRSVSDHLYCSGKKKRWILSQLQEALEDYLLQNPDADLEMIQAHLGTPQEIAASYVSEQDASVLLKQMRIKKKVLAVVAGGTAAVMLVWFGYVGWATHNARTTNERLIEVSVEQK